MAGLEGAVEQFAEGGLIDRQKVGMIGFSRSGWLVDYFITHFQVSIAAALVADNIDGSYFQYVLAGSDLRRISEADKGRPPFGNGLEVWAHDAPGFNADKVHTPLRLELDSGPITFILGQWEMFSNLRYLRKPVGNAALSPIEKHAAILSDHDVSRVEVQVPQSVRQAQLC